MIYHILNGDGLAQHFDLDGEIIVFRECLIDGDVRAENLNELWRVRAEYIKKKYGDEAYFDKVIGELDKFKNLKSTEEVNLWFGDEAFCQINMSFILWAYGDKTPNFYRVFPDAGGWNCGFQNLEQAFENRQKLSSDEIKFGASLWEKYQSGDKSKLWNTDNVNKLHTLPNFKNLVEVCQALIEIDTRPKEILEEITKTGETDFGKIFQQFQAKAGVYGFGDLQVKNILNSI